MTDKKKTIKIPELTSAQTRFLRARAHDLQPLVHIGKEGITEALISATSAELDHHELIKVKIGNNSGLEKKETCQEVAERTGSALVQLIGKIFVLYRPNREKAKDKRLLLPKS